MKGFIRLLQDDDDDIPARGGSPPSAARAKANVFLTLPALEAFVEGGDAFLAQKERAALARRQSRDANCSADHGPPEPATGSTREGSDGAGACAPRPRTNSWAAEAPEGDGDSAYGKAGDKESALLERLRSTLARAAAAAATTSQIGENVGGGGGGVGGRASEDSVRGHLDSFDVDGDGVLLPEELVAALRSLGARGGEFFGQHGVNALVSRFREGGDKPAAGTPNGASVVKLAWWFDEQESKEVGPAGYAVGHRGSSSSNRGRGGPASSLPPGKERGPSTSGPDTEEGGVVAGGALRRAVRLAEAKGTTLERTFARLDDDGDGFITLRELLRGLDQLGVFKQVTYLHKHRKEKFPWNLNFRPVAANLHQLSLDQRFCFHRAMNLRLREVNKRSVSRLRSLLFRGWQARAHQTAIFPTNRASNAPGLSRRRPGCAGRT